MAVDSVRDLGSELGYRFFAKALDASPDARAVYDEMVRQGVEPQAERTQLFSIFSTDSLQSIAISITPFSTKDLTREGGLSLSQGGHAQGVIVEISERTKIIGFTHIAVTGGSVVTSTHDVDELRRERPAGVSPDQLIRAQAEQAGKISVDRPLVEIDARQVRSLASISYNSLLGDDFSLSVHDQQEITSLRANTDIVSEIGLFVLFRTSGSSCCSCSCSCWGSSSCSSSAVA